ncbi:Oxidoreductase claN [Exophiala dermatitidis]
MSQGQRSKTWLVTGASQGLGLAITLAALRAGHKVIAGARNPEAAASAHPEVEKAGGQWLQLDVTSKETKDIVQKAAENAGGIDVVVNNAGYFLAGSIEDLDEEEMQAAMDTNFWGPIRVLKGALPSMRARKSGTIVSISSIFAFYPCPGGAMYSCPKAAQDALQSILGKELASFNIRTVIINAGLYKTNVLVNSKQPSNGFSESYLAPLGPVLNTVGTLVQDPSQMPGDPTKFGERIVDVVDGTGLAKGLENTSRFWFGRDAVKLSSIVMKELEESFKESNAIATSTDFEGHTGDGVAVVSDYYK